MRITRRALLASIFLLPLLLVSLCGYFAIRQYLREAREDLAPLLAAELTKQLGHEVKVGNVEIDGGKATVFNIRLAQGKTFGSGQGEMARANRVVLDFDLRRILLGSDPELPLVANVEVFKPCGRVARDRVGRWNFEDLIKPRLERPKRQTVGTITISDGELEYADQSPPHHAKRKSVPLSASFNHVSGRIDFNADQTVTWSASGQETTGRVRAASVLGSYEPEASRLSLGIDAESLSLPLIAQLAPPEYNSTTGLVSGHLAILRNAANPKDIKVDFLSNVRVEQASVTSSQITEPATSVQGLVTVSNAGVTANLDGVFTGSRVHAEGNVTGFDKPYVSGWVSGEALDIKRLMQAARIENRYAFLRSLSATGKARADLWGPLDKLQLRAEGDVIASGSPIKDVAIPVGSPIHLTVSGPLDAPAVLASGRLPIARFLGHEARDVEFNADYAPKKAAVDFTGRFAGGSVGGRANLTIAEKQTRYVANVSVRGLNATRLKDARQRKLAGLIDGDAVITGKLGQGIPQGRGSVRVASLRYDKWSASDVRAGIRTSGDYLFINSALIHDRKGMVIVEGSANLKKRTIDVRVEADAVDVAALPIARGEDGKSSLNGTVYLRGGTVKGSFDKPTVAGTIRGYDLQSGDRVKLDFATAHLNGTRESVEILDGQAWRFPGFVSFAGQIDDPMEDEPSIRLAGDFGKVDLQDIATLTASEIDASGTVAGKWSAIGSLKKPIVNVQNIEATQVAIGKSGFDRLTATAIYDATKGNGELSFPQFTAEFSRSGLEGKPELVISGNAVLDGDRRFTLNAGTNSVSLDLLSTTVGDYVLPTGTIDAHGSLQGVFREGKAKDLRGGLAASTHDLKLNGSSFGDLTADLKLGNDEVTGTILPTDFKGMDRISGIYLDRFSYKISNDKLDAAGAVEGVALDMLRVAFASSPFVVRDPEGVVASTIKTFKPFAGSLRADFHVTGAADSPAADVKWSNVGPLGIEDLDIKSLAAHTTFGKNLVQLHDFTLMAENGSANASGTYVPGKTLDGTLDVNEVPLEILRKWFPPPPERKPDEEPEFQIADLIHGLTGLADHVQVSASGKPGSPKLIASVLLKNVKWVDPDKKRKLFGGRVLEFPTISTSTIVVDNNMINIEDLGIKVMEPPLDLPKAAGITFRGPHEVHALGYLGFSWDTPHILENEKAKLQVTIKNQKLGLLRAFLADSEIVLDGDIESAALTYEGALSKLIRPRQVVTETGPDQATLNGDLKLIAKRIALPDYSTEVHNLKANVKFNPTEDRLQIVEFSAETQVTNPRFPKLKGEPITVTGELPIQKGRKESTLRLTAKKLVYAEAPLGSYKSAMAVGEISTESPATPGEAITIGGTVFAPTISGTVYLRNTYVRLPDEVDPSKSSTGLSLPFSSFNLKIVAENNVRMATSLIDASVRTSSADPVMITGTGTEPNIAGAFVIEKGTLQFPTAFFNIRKGGEVAFRYPYNPGGLIEDKKLGVLLNLSATTRISATSIVGTRKRYTITVEARGPLFGGSQLSITDPNDLTSTPFTYRGLRLTFRSDPPDLARSSAALQQRVTEVLGGRTAIEGLFAGNFKVQGVVGDIFSQSILPGIFERSGLARSLGLEEFEIEYSQQDAFSIRVSRQLFGPVLVGYWRRLGSANRSGSVDRASWEFKLSYRLREDLQFSWTIDEQKTNAYLLERVFKF